MFVCRAWSKGCQLAHLFANDEGNIVNGKVMQLPTWARMVIAAAYGLATCIVAGLVAIAVLWGVSSGSPSDMWGTTHNASIRSLVGAGMFGLFIASMPAAATLSLIGTQPRWLAFAAAPFVLLLSFGLLLLHPVIFVVGWLLGPPVLVLWSRQTPG
jgi:hypothetical protein